MTFMYNPATGRNNSPIGGGGFNPYAAGDKRYGAGQRRNPNQGAAQDMTGYGARDLRNKARTSALMRWVGRN